MTEIEIKIAENLSRLRRRAGLRQKDLAEKLGLRSATVSNWENKYNSMDIETLLRVCDALGVDIKEMCGLVKSEEDGGYPRKVELSRREHIVLTAYQRQPEMRAAVERLLQVDFSTPPEEERVYHVPFSQVRLVRYSDCDPAKVLLAPKRKRKHKRS